MTLLDNPIWAALSTLHRHLALGDGELLRYPADVAPFAGTAAGAPIIDSELVGEGERLLMMGPRPAGFVVEDLGRLHQMVIDEPAPVPDGPAILPLGVEHHAAIRELTALVYPHYFRPRTVELGRYFGIFDGDGDGEGGRLAAMIGERLGAPGFRELSAICTHPDFAGRGLARRLTTFLTHDLFARGQQPFLHVSPDNERARRLYERLGYRTRVMIPFWSLRKI